MAKRSITEEIQTLIQLERELPATVPQLIDDPTLTPRQLIFVEEYLKCNEGKLAARKAGYSETSAHVTAHLLLENPKIIAAIEKMWAAMRLAAEIPKNRVERELYEIVVEAKGQKNPMVLLKALDMIAKINGLYAPNVMLQQDNSLVINYIVPNSGDSPKII